MIATVSKKGWALEFSSGIPYRSDMEAVYLNASIRKIPHNYFPAPEVPFVLNLGSSDLAIRSKSIEHCKKGLWLSQQSGAPFFSAHAGFCIDPDPSQLGRKIEYKPEFNKIENKRLFIESIQTILETADKLGVDFLVENNVIASFNLTDSKINPLLCCESAEIKWLFDEVKNDRLGLLLDTAHLKVSCQALDLQLHKELRKIMMYVKAIHHSDNDGKIDDNQELNSNYWFLPYMSTIDTSIVHIIEVKNISKSTIEKQITLLTNGS